MAVLDVGPAGAAVALQKVLGAVEDLGVYDGRVLTVVNLVLVGDLAEVNPVCQQSEEAVLVERPAAHLAAPRRSPMLRSQSPFFEDRRRG